MLLMHKVRSFVGLPLRVQLWLVPAWLLLGASRFAILTVSFRRLAPLLGMHHGALPWIPLLSPAQEKTARQLAAAIALAARYTPWQSNCFPQAVTARCLLGVHGVPYMLFFGVARDADGSALKAHAWVSAGRVRVSGGYSFASFRIVGCFMARSLSVVSRGLP